jgi:adenylate cyclase
MLKRWLLNQALLATPVPQLAQAFADQLVPLGLPIWRLHVGFSTIHPEVESIGVTWTRDGKREREEYGHGSFEGIAGTSPFYDAVVAAQTRARTADDNALASIPMTRYHLERGEGLQSYNLLASFHAAGATDYLCFVIVFGNSGHLSVFTSGAAVSLTTDRTGGFTDSEIASLTDIMPALGVAVRAGAEPTTTRNLLDIYLGRDIGGRVLSGEVRRGSVEVISAAMFVGDLRGFTMLAETVPRDDLVVLLNDYLDCLIAPIETAGGQILKFLGDGLLATFSFADTDAPTACAAALSAAMSALQSVNAMNEKRAVAKLPLTVLDLALHAGDVLYGNVGANRRLDFTIIGPAVNEAARLEALCSVLDVPLIASSQFVELLGATDRFRSLGPQLLRGVRRPVEVFSLV